MRDAYAAGDLYLSGVRDYDSRTPQEQVEALARAPLAHQPGTTWEYSISVDVLGRVAEAVARERLGDFMEKRIFRPLRMNDTAFWITGDRLTRASASASLSRTTSRQALGARSPSSTSPRSRVAA